VRRDTVGWVAGTFAAGVLLAVAVRFADTGFSWLTRSTPYLVPTMLPPAPRPFVGRMPELANVVAMLSRAGGTRPALMLISGRAGIGKTAFAIKAAHDLAESFPDGQLFADCRVGSAPTREDIDNRVSDILADFVAALQYQTEDVPTGRHQRAERYRELTRDRRVLVVLDDTDDQAIVAALSPSGARCAVIVTCRTAPAWLPSSDGHVRLDNLAEADAMQLLQDIAGDRINTEEPQARAIVRSTRRHPLAVRAAATAIAARPKTSLTVAVSRYADQSPMPKPDDPDERALDFTYALLTDDEKTAIRMIGLLNLHRFQAWKIGALLNIDERAAEQLANRLVSSGLLSRSSQDAAGVPVFSVHDHVLRYAQLRYEQTADDKPRTVRLRDFEDRSSERKSFGVADLDLASTVYLPLDNGNVFGALAAARAAVGRARDGADPQARGLALAALAEVQTEIGNADAAVDLATSVLRDPRTTGLSRARALRCLGRLDRRHRRLDAAGQHLTRALSADESGGDNAERAKTLAELAIVQALAGARGRAVSTLESAWDILAKLSDDRQSGRAAQPFGRLYVETRLRWHAGYVYQEIGAHDRALKTLRGEDDGCMSRGLEPRLMRGWIAHRIGKVLLDPDAQTRDLVAARRSATDGQELFGEMNHRYGKAHCRNIMGQTYLAEGQVGAALPLLERALENFTGCGDRWEEGSSALVLAGAYESAGGQVEAAGRLRELALNIFTDLGDLAQVRAVRKLLDAREPVAEGPTGVGQ
jgi:tetratricopeptide (TPR) repeat protein